ncbi:MAG: acyl-CoA/acyl-ACP dehydrogenase [Gammaproteobacteria bacterium]|nr:acyl-CoA/acyl-ACP dehydrogenase [Gammaproteobacteria bacterium]
MQFAFTEEQDLIREAAQTFFREHGASQRVRAAMETPLGYDEGSWATMVREMGWAGIALPESVGGTGLGNVELAILQEEAGRCVQPSPFFSTVCLAAPAIRHAGTPAQQESLLGPIATGEARAALALTGAGGAPGLEGIGVTLERSGRKSRLVGEASYVVHGHAADLLVVAARSPGSRGAEGVSLIALPAGTKGVRIEKLVALDLTRPMARIRLENVEVTTTQILGEPEAAAAALTQALRLAQIALAAEQTGGAQGALETTTAYAKQRVQFGRAIGSFQAIKHRLADMMIAAEAAKSAAYYAACIADTAIGELAEAAAIAKSRCSDAFFDCAANMVQLHGGIGFTWEHDAQLYFKRARASSTLLGTPQYHRELLAQLMGLGAAS